MGFVLEEPLSEQSELVDTPLKAAVEQATNLVSSLSSSDESSFTEALQGTPGRVLVAVRRFAKVLNDAQAMAEIVGDTESVHLGSAEIDILYGRLSDLNVEETAATLEALLLGILPESHRFELQLDGGEQTLSGPISDELVLRYLSGGVKELVLTRVTARVTFVRTLRGSELIKETVVLEDVTSLSAAPSQLLDS
jgi:hypothetical protein